MTVRTLRLPSSTNLFMALLAIIVIVVSVGTDFTEGDNYFSIFKKLNQFTYINFYIIMAWDLGHFFLTKVFQKKKDYVPLNGEPLMRGKN